MRAATLAAAGLACAGAALTIAAFAGGGSGTPEGASRQPQAVGAARGHQVFVEQGCGSCHAFAPAGTSGPIGPDLTFSLRGRSRAYVLESIVMPGRQSADHHEVGGMPEDYAERIAPRDLEPLVDFLVEGAREHRR